MSKSFSPEIQTWDITKIVPYAANTKNHPRSQIDKLKSGILEFGWDVPIVVDGDGVIIKGHGRRLAALELGLKQVPVIVRTDLSEAEKKASRIHDNKSAESSWDTDLLKVEFEALGEMGFNLDMTGFGELEIGDIFLGETPEPGDEMDHEPSIGSLDEAPAEDEQVEPSEEAEEPGDSRYEIFSKEAIVEAAFHHFREAGFPYHSLPIHACLQQINKLAATPSDKLCRSTVAHHIGDTYHPHRFHAPAENMKSVFDGFSDDKLLQKAIALEVDYAMLGDKYFSSLNFVSGVQVLSNFRPGFALSLYRRFATPESVILDTSTGYGGRLVGFMASGCAQYIGIDPNVPTYKANLKMADDLGFSDRVELINLPAEDVQLETLANRCDFAFTSPPYFRKEHYSQDATQSWQRYPSGDAWRDGFLYPLMRLQFSSLKRGSHAAMNIADVQIGKKIYPLGQWTIDAGVAAGFEFLGEEKFPCPRVMGKKDESGDKKEAYEPVFIFRKP